MRAIMAPVLLCGFVVLGSTACGGDDGDGGDGGAGVDGSGFPDSSGPGADGPPGGADSAGPTADAPPLGTTQRSCAFRVRFTDTTSVLDGECRAYTPVMDRFRSVTAGGCYLTVDESLGLGTTVVEATGTITATGAGVPGTPIVAAPDANEHYSTSVTAIIAAVGQTIAVSSSGGTVPAIPEVTLTRPPTMTFDARPEATISKAAGWTVPHQASTHGQLRVTISQNMGNFYKKAVCLADATATSLVVPVEISSEFYVGTAFAAFEAVDEVPATAGDYAVGVSATAGITLAAGGALTGMSVTFAD